MPEFWVFRELHEGCKCSPDDDRGVRSTRGPGALDSEHAIPHPNDTQEVKAAWWSGLHGTAFPLL